MTTLARVLSGLAVLGLGIFIVVADEGCATMGSACRNTGSTMAIFAGVAVMAGGVVLMMGPKALERLAQQQRKR